MMRRLGAVLAMAGWCRGFVAVTAPRGLVCRATVPELSAGTEENEVKLAELIFSAGDPRMDIATAPEEYGDEFCSFVLAKADASEDMEERVALKSLVEMIRQVKSGLEKARDEAETELFEEQEELVRRESAADILSAANAALGSEVARSEGVEAATEAGLSGDALRTYDALLSRLLRADADGSLATEVEANYETCDYSLLTLADARRESDPAAYGRVVEAVNALAAKRLESAAARLQSVLRAGAPEKMMQKVTELAATGNLDAPLVELLEANRQQAEAAGAAPAAELMRRLANRCRDEMDKRVGEKEPEKKLLRALLRCEDGETREKLLRRAFEPKEAIELSFDGRKTEEGPDVEPPKFIDACRTLIADFGNVDLDGRSLAESVKYIAELAEAVAIDIYGESASPREQQDRMWAEQTTSVFDLEAAEFQAESEGKRMPWQNDAYDDMLPPGFDQQTGVKRIGGV